MKKSVLRICAALTALLLALIQLVSCSSLGTPVMTLGKTEITGSMIEFWMSRYKAQFEYSYGQSLKTAYGLSSVDSIWKVKVKDDSAETYDDMFSSYIFDNAKTYLCALYLFDQFGLKLPDSTVKKTDETINEYVTNLADGSKSEFNAILAAYGINMKILRKLYLADEKVSYLREYLFGSNGTEPITTQQIEDYYQKNYVRMKQICVFINQRPKQNEDGTYVTDSSGKTQYTTMTADENAAARTKIEEALAKIDGGEDFEKALSEYDENKADDGYKNGIYMSAESSFGNDEDLQKIYETLCEMKVGEVRELELSNSLHIIKKYELDTGAYAKAENSDFFLFNDGSGSYQTLQQYVKTPLFLDYIKGKLDEFSADIKIDEEALSQYRISKVKSNYNF
ncbi:ppiC-type peptidyl-prolyl cis-trans isomerase [Anaerotruncus sp. CAG:390]|nr:ppiC-type peptidyl-prolyl cis-trans isomerase [Anaerotruncus sp. CAG:390]